MSRKPFAPLLILATTIALPAPVPVSASSTRYVYTDLGVLGGLASQAWTTPINDAGQIVGAAIVGGNGHVLADAGLTV
jgi:hypothetical protein